nr:hypothetical protein [Micromonospora sp. DSM 115978]
MSGYTVITSLAGLAFAGLVLDAGLAIATKVDAVSIAQSSARAGASELDVAYLRATGVIRLDPIKAQDTAQQWVNNSGLTGTATVAGNTVTVSVSTARDTQLLQMIGITSIPIAAHATATAVQP